MKAMRILGAMLVLVAIAAAIVPAATNCTGLVTLKSGKQIPMKCNWTAQASIATALPLGLLGLALAMAKRKETRRALAVVATGLGAALLLLPTVLIGTCATYDMECNLVMKPTMLGLGILTIVIAGVVFLMSRGNEPEVAE